MAAEAAAAPVAPPPPALVAGGADAQPDFSRKHKLETGWRLYFDNPTTKQSLSKFGQGLRSVYAFDTVEDFWGLYNNIKAPSQLQPSATYFLFREGIEPKWEDPNNAAGGCWTANPPRGATNPRAVLDAWWLHSVLACVGEQFTEGSEICGVTVNIRQGGKDRIELWTRTAANEALTMSVGRDLKRLLDVPDSSKFGYVVFADKLQSGKGRDRYSL